MVRSMLSVLHYNNNVRCEKNGTRKVISTKTRPSKANPGSMVTKTVKSPASVQYKYDIIEQCIKAVEVRNLNTEQIPTFAQEGETIMDAEEIEENEQNFIMEELDDIESEIEDADDGEPETDDSDLEY